jgi:hypothetical protein
MTRRKVVENVADKNDENKSLEISDEEMIDGAC